MTNPSTTGASHSKQDMTHRLGAWLKHHQRVSGESLGTLLGSGLSSLMTWLVIGIALALPAILLVTLNNLGTLSGSWDGNPKINLFLDKHLQESAAGVFSRELRDWPEVKAVTLIRADDALAEFQALSGLGDALLALEDNPLPAVILLEPVNPAEASLRLMVKRLEARPEVASVSVDLAWVARLHAMLNLGERMVISVSMFLGLGVLLIIGNTIRLAIENRRTEIEVIKLVGGTDAFVRRPFLYLGFWYGLGGALIAWLLMLVSLAWLEAPVQKLAGTYGTGFSLIGLDWEQTLGFLLLGALLGVAGAWLAVGRHLRQIEP